MPVTAKLSRQFYEKLGDEVANELVTWFNAVDEGYRQEFRDLFEAHFGRFEARLGEFVAGTDAKLVALEARINARFAAIEARFDAKLAALEARFDGQLVALEARFDGQLMALEGRVDVKLAQMEKRLIRWMFGFWIGTVLTVVLAMIALQRLR